MGEDEDIKTMFSRFQPLFTRLKVLNKSYITTNYVNKTVRSLLRKYRPNPMTI